MAPLFLANLCRFGHIPRCAWSASGHLLRLHLLHELIDVILAISRRRVVECPTSCRPLMKKANRDGLDRCRFETAGRLAVLW